MIMKYDERVTFLKALNQPRKSLAIKEDLSLHPEYFGHELRVKGLYLWGHAFSEESRFLSNITCVMILYNETDKQKVIAPDGFDLFHIRDVQEFAYVAAVRVHQDE